MIRLTTPAALAAWVVLPKRGGRAEGCPPTFSRMDDTMRESTPAPKPTVPDDSPTLLSQGVAAD